MVKKIKILASIFILALLSVAMVICPAPCLADDNVPIERMKSSVGLVVMRGDIQYITAGRVEQNVPLATGSCFMVGNGDFAVTNHHVIDAQSVVSELMNKNPVNISNVQISVIFFDKFGNEIGEFKSDVIDSNSGKDLAIITLPSQIRDAGVEPVKFLHDEKIKVSMDVYAVGFPFASFSSAMSKDHTVTKGVVSKVKAKDGERYCVQTDAAINSGNSGGALYDKHGNIIGVNTFVFNHAIAEGMNFAVQSCEIVSFLTEHGVPVAYAGDAPQNSEGQATPTPDGTATVTTSGQTTGEVDPIYIVLIGAIILLVVTVVIYLGKVNSSRNSANLNRPMARQNSPRGHGVPSGRVRVADGVFTLTGVKGSFTGMNIPFHSFPASMGRDTSVCKVQFAPNTKGVSRVHCTISFSSGVFSVLDTSTYGTFLNGNKLAPNTPTKLHNGDMLACAGETFRVTIRS